MKDLPYGRDRAADSKAKADDYIGKKSGGGVHDDEKGTKININIGKPDTGAPGGPNAAGGLLGALAQASKPPPPPPMPMGGPPGMGPGGPGGPPPGGPPMPGMKRGGAASMTAGAGNGAGRLEKAAVSKRGK